MVRFPSPINGDEDTLQFLKPNLVRPGNISSQGYCTDKLDCGWEFLRLLRLKFKVLRTWRTLARCIKKISDTRRAVAPYDTRPTTHHNHINQNPQHFTKERSRIDSPLKWWDENRRSGKSNSNGHARQPIRGASEPSIDTDTKMHKIVEQFRDGIEKSSNIAEKITFTQTPRSRHWPNRFGLPTPNPPPRRAAPINHTSHTKTQ